MLLTRHPLGQGLLCAVQMYALHPENWGQSGCHHCVCWVSHERREYSVLAAMAAVPTRAE